MGLLQSCYKPLPCLFSIALLMEREVRLALDIQNSICVTTSTFLFLSGIAIEVVEVAAPAVGAAVVEVVVETDTMMVAGDMAVVGLAGQCQRNLPTQLTSGTFQMVLSRVTSTRSSKPRG